ncbi:MAG: 4-hydroxythreonine-4-phosphate dehydrogenase PdxA [Gemmatimonadota bacterium]
MRTDVRATWVTMGDARGVGPEVAIRALAGWSAPGPVRLVGVRAVWERAASEAGLDDLFRRLESAVVEVAGDDAGVIEADPRAIPPAVAGAWAGRSIEVAVGALKLARGDLLVTAPLDKAALQAGGYGYPGHTEMLGALTGTPKVAMMLVAGRLRVTLVTGHVPLRQAPGRVTPAAIRDAFLHTHHALRKGFGVDGPRIAVCGLNPHAGDGGALGDEEERVVAPALRALRAEGFQVAGPLSADTVFVRAIAGEFDAVLALYHDQGMIPVKLHGFGRGVNVTLGLPFVRTSPDHGTALDLAGTGRASHQSFSAALELAAELGERPDFTR